MLKGGRLGAGGCDAVWLWGWGAVGLGGCGAGGCGAGRLGYGKLKCIEAWGAGMQVGERAGGVGRHGAALIYIYDYNYY